MNNLHRELAPISEAAWADLEEETTRTLKRYLAARRVVDERDEPVEPPPHVLGRVARHDAEPRALLEVRAPDEPPLGRRADALGARVDGAGLDPRHLNGNHGQDG